MDFLSKSVEVALQYSTDDEQFWTAMFEGLKIAEKLSEITASRDKGQTLHSTGYGDVVLKCRTATKEGDGYMSDNFILDAAIKNGTVYRCFTKVKID